MRWLGYVTYPGGARQVLAVGDASASRDVVRDEAVASALLVGGLFGPAFGPDDVVVMAVQQFAARFPRLWRKARADSSLLIGAVSVSVVKERAKQERASKPNRPTDVRTRRTRRSSSGASREV